MNLHTHFLIGSIAKQFTAFQIIQLAQKGEVKLHDHIGKYFSDVGKDWKDEVRLHHLLCHTSGIVDLKSPLQSTPGEKFSYSNIGYNLLGRVIETVTNKSYIDNLNSLFQGFNMVDTLACKKMPSQENFAKGHYEDKQGNITIANQKRYEANLPSGGGALITTTLDLAKWNQQFYKNKQSQAMTSPQSYRSHRWSEKLSYGYGLQISHDPNEFSHSGYVDGYSSTLIYYPDYDLSVVVLENTSWDTSDLHYTSHSGIMMRFETAHETSL